MLIADELLETVEHPLPASSPASRRRNIGEVRSAVWRTYLAIDWRATGMDPAAYWQDLCELRLWEPYGLDFKAEDAWFRSARKEDVPVIESILLALEAQHREVVLDHPADEALDALADGSPPTEGTR